MLDFEFELEELPPAPNGWLPSPDGIPGNTDIETELIGRLEADEVMAVATDLLPPVVEKQIHT